MGNLFRDCLDSRWIHYGRVGTDVNQSMGDSAASHEGTDYLEPDPRDDEQITVTRRQLRIMVQTMLDLKLKDHVHLEKVS